MKRRFYTTLYRVLVFLRLKRKHAPQWIAFAHRPPANGQWCFYFNSHPEPLCSTMSYGQFCTEDPRFTLYGESHHIRQEHTTKAAFFESLRHHYWYPIPDPAIVFRADLP